MSLRDWTVSKKKGKVRNKKMTVKDLLSCLNNAIDCLWTPCYVRETSQYLLKPLSIQYFVTLQGIFREFPIYSDTFD